jgi:integrase
MPVASVVPYPLPGDRPDRPTRWRVYFQGPGGKRVCRAFRGGKREAERWGQEQEAQWRARPAARPPSPQTLRDYLAEWLPAHVARKGLRPRTAESYAFLAQHYVLPHLGHVRLSDLTPAMVDTWLRRLQTEPTPTRQRLAPATVQRAHQVLHAALAAAARAGRITENPMDRVERPVAPRTEAEAFAPAEIAAIRRAAAGHRLGPLFLLCLDLGLRLGEALALRWEDVDFAGGTLSVRRGTVELHADPEALADPERLRAMWAGQQERRLRRVYQGTKTAAGRRAWPLPPTTADTLLAWRERQAQEQALVGAAWRDTGLVFTTSRGTALLARNVTRSWAALLRDAGVPYRRLHTTRHTAASRALTEAGLTPVETAAMLGHATPAVTMQVYAHLLDPTRAAAGRRVAEALAREAERARRADAPPPEGTER